MGETVVSRWAAGAPRAGDGEGGGRSLAELCHDLRHPAAAIDALVAAVQVECDLPGQAHARLLQIAAEARSISALCGQVLSHEMARGDDLVRLDDVARQVALAAQASHPGVEVVTVPVVAAIDEAGARRILWNLLDNAMRAAGPDGHVLVTVWTTDRHVRLEVADSGPGFGHGTTGAAGLGLSIVQATARRFGGELEMSHSTLGGALVAVLFPHSEVDLPEVFGRDAQAEPACIET